MMESAPEQGDEVTTHQGGRPPGSTNAETLDRRRRVARLLATRGAMSATEISELLGIHISTATRDLAAIKAEWREEMLASTDAVMARDLAELGMVKQEAWRVYAKSLDHKPQIVTETERPGGVEVVTTTMDPKPDLNALKLVQTCIEKKRKVLGLDKDDGSDRGPKSISFTVRIGERVLVSESSVGNHEDILDAEMVELDSQGKALPSGDQGK
jgi:arginine repressor